jgi:hypothetical protein
MTSSKYVLMLVRDFIYMSADAGVPSVATAPLLLIRSLLLLIVPDVPGLSAVASDLSLANPLLLLASLLASRPFFDRQKINFVYKGKTMVAK